MSAENERLTTEFAHVLMMDLVGYSRLPMEKQESLTQELRELVRSLKEFVRAERRSELVCNDTGDGMVLVFLRDPVAPVNCAVELARVLESRPHLRLRMGVNSGPITRYKDIVGKENASGSGVNMAQRVMDCGDAGHILLSRTSAEVMMQFEGWASSIHYLGEAAIKHEERIPLYNLHSIEVGNKERPSRLAGEKPPKSSSTGKSTLQPEAVPAGKAVVPQRVAIVYKRNQQPDERLLSRLETLLNQRGHSVFIDRHLAIGVEWAMEIDRQIRAADAVVALLSEASLRSEMLDYEIQTAHKAAQAQEGRPRLLPVRIAYEGPLSEAVAPILDALMYTLWNGEADDDRVIAEIVNALENPTPQGELPKLESVGGAVPLESKFYITRPTDAEFRSAIARQDSIVLVKGARQMGKTSLLARGLQQARESGAKVVLTDFQTLNARHLESAETLYLTLAEMIADQLDLETFPSDVWVASRGPNMNLERYLRREVLGATDAPIVWGMDEVDRLFACDFGSEVFGLFRSWHNRRSLDPNGPWSRLTLAIAYATEAHLFITDMNQSPFNVGTRLTLDDFTLDQVYELNRRYGAPLQNSDEVTRFFQLLSGQPYLVRRGLDDMVNHHIPFIAFSVQADRDEGLFGDHLRRILMSLSQNPELRDAVKAVLQNQPCPSPESFYALRSAGVLAGDSARDARLRCQLYAAYLSRHLL